VLKVFADEHVAHALVNGLRTRGMDVVTVQDVGLRSEDDPPLLDFAFREQRILLTNDHDFLAHAAERSARLEPFAPIVY
jgi:predicted nuclease of predicted toxin-antitoxin system